MEVKIDLALLDAVVGYLGTRPYQEVQQLIAAIQHQVGPQVKKDESVIVSEQ